MFSFGYNHKVFFLFAKKHDEKPYKIAKAKIRYEWTTTLSTCWKNASNI